MNLFISEGVMSREYHSVDNIISQWRRASLPWTSPRFAPVEMLPNEVLSHIFELGALGQEEINKSPWNHSFSRVCEFQLSVSHVSRHFRNVAVGTPALWTVIYTQGLEDSQVDYIKTSLKRSGSLPLTISLDCEAFQFDLEETKPIIDEIMAIVKVNLYRLKRFFAKFLHISILHQIMEYMNEPAPQLTTFELSYTRYFELHVAERLTTPDPQFLLFDGQTPKLTKLLLEGAHVLQWPYYDLRNLTVLGLRYQDEPTYEEFRTVIRNSPSLRELSLQGLLPLPLLDEEAEEEDDDDDSFILESLERLEIAGVPPYDAMAAISFIHAPNVKSLILADMEGEDYSNLLDLIAKSPVPFPNLISLTLVDVQGSESALATLLHAYPQLESLDLYRGSNCNARWVNVLEGTGTSEGLHLCPNLKCLRCVSIELEDIQDVLKKRAEANIPLPKLQLANALLRESYTSGDPSALIWLQKNVQLEFLDFAYDNY